MRVRARKDSNHKKVVAMFRELGATVLDTAQLGFGAPDLVIAYNNKNVLVEIKDGSLPPSKRKLTEDEKQFHAMWKGHIVVINDLKDVIELMQSL